MLENQKIAAVIPCYCVKEQVAKVLEKIPQEIDYIICVDDACPEGSGDLIETLKYSVKVASYHPRIWHKIFI
ncbi:MAG: hypothetical protein IJ523_03565 [Succinivibrionaceae bacterium]|nr:hypothetical protein [Succinivibrionaceae bacterium]